MPIVSPFMLSPPPVISPFKYTPLSCCLTPSGASPFLLSPLLFVPPPLPCITMVTDLVWQRCTIRVRTHSSQNQPRRRRLLLFQSYLSGVVLDKTLVNGWKIWVSTSKVTLINVNGFGLGSISDLSAIGSIGTDLEPKTDHS